MVLCAGCALDAAGTDEPASIATVPCAGCALDAAGTDNPASASRAAGRAAAGGDWTKAGFPGA